jgi:hypothetical protein
MPPTPRFTRPSGGGAIKWLLRNKSKWHNFRNSVPFWHSFSIIYCIYNYICVKYSILEQFDACVSGQCRVSALISIYFNIL